MLEKRAFDPEFLKRLDGLVLGSKRARTVRAGRRTIGRIQGGGIEPENFREYAEGDDLRFLDWNAYARLDSLSIRTFRAERQVEMTIMIDASASMALPARDDKLGLALLLGAGLAYIGLGENDPVRLAAFGRWGRRSLEITPFLRRRESYISLRPFVGSIRGRGESRLAEAVGELLSERRSPGIVIVISDFLVASNDYEEAFRRLQAAHHEIKAVHVLGDQESTGSYPIGAYRVRDCETGEFREVSFGPRQAEACRARVERHASALRDFCATRGIMYSSAFGASHLDEIMAREFPRLGVIA